MRPPNPSRTSPPNQNPGNDSGITSFDESPSFNTREEETMGALNGSGPSSDTEPSIAGSMRTVTVPPLVSRSMLFHSFKKLTMMCQHG